MSRAFEIGDRVVADTGVPEDDDAGVVMAVRGDGEEYLVGWDSCVQTWTPGDLLEPEPEDYEPWDPSTRDDEDSEVAS